MKKLAIIVLVVFLIAYLIGSIPINNRCQILGWQSGLLSYQDGICFDSRNYTYTLLSKLEEECKIRVEQWGEEPCPQ